MLGEIVLIRKNAFGSDYKIADKCKDEPHEVISQYKDFPVFIVQSIVDPKAKERVLYRSMLHSAHSVEQEVIPEPSTEDSGWMALAKANHLIEEYFQQGY